MLLMFVCVCLLVGGVNFVFYIPLFFTFNQSCFFLLLRFNLSNFRMERELGKYLYFSLGSFVCLFARFSLFSRHTQCPHSVEFHRRRWWFHKRNDVRLLLRILLCIWFRSGEIVHKHSKWCRERERMSMMMMIMMRNAHESKKKLKEKTTRRTKFISQSLSR